MNTFKYTSFFLTIIFMITQNYKAISADIQKDYTSIVQSIIDKALSDSIAYQRLEYMCDTYGPRLSGSENLNKALMWIKDEMNKDGFENVIAEEVYVPHWVRGNEWCKLVEPREANMPMLGLGGSIATPKEGITAPVIVVHSYEELEKRANEAKGKIVLYSKPWLGYGDAVQFRTHGAEKAAAVGAIASLIRSCSPVGMRNPHTGMMVYSDAIPKIPHAAITLEDALMLERLGDRGQNPIVSLYMEAKTLPDTLSYNIMGEIRGTEMPEEIVVLGGHSDSWDAGTGAQDDGGGCIATWHALKLLKELGIKPKRTIRAVMFVNEENGVKGGKAYADKHKNEKHHLMFEFDSGVFAPDVIGFSASDSLMEIVKGFEKYLQMVDTIKVTKGGWGVDISPLARLDNIPVMSLGTKDEGKYFWYHHSPTDTPDKVDPVMLNKCIAAIAIAVYLYSEL
ncbi:MAG: M20/M25/M40 family metallo-hydrolase [Ignavibacteriae bacterium]|nr:M20/M25/M40 family metallo-hydrolase [Ignavibacteriota bacterium]